MIYRTGKLAKETDERTLQLGRYLAPALPAPPPACDYAAKILAWRMLGNDRVGDCALAGQAHADMLWAKCAEGRELRISEAMVIGAYAKLTGYVPGGVNTQTAARRCSPHDGLGEGRHRRQRLRAFVEVDRATRAT